MPKSMGVSFCLTVGLAGKKGESGETLKKVMAQRESVLPNCVYAPNPYHECTEACLQKIKETKPGKPTKNRKSFDYRRNITDGELGKKMNNEKRRPSGCPKASNPYHVCAESCQNRMSVADSGAVSLNFDRKKKLGSKPEPPVLDSVPPSKIGAIYLSDASSPLSNYSEKTKEKPKSNELIIPVSGEIQVVDVMSINDKVHSKGGAEHPANAIRTKHNGDKNASPKVVPIISADDTGGLTKPDGGSMNYCFSGALNDNDESDGEETESVVSESRVPVGKYHVKESFAPILRSIFEKYGDIGASCHLESVVMRSYYIECVCFLIQELQSTPIMELTKSKVKELLAILKDVESAQLRVAWLRSIVDEVAENVELVHEHRVAEMAKANSDREMKALNKELESEMESLAQKEQEVRDMKARVEGIRERLKELEMKSSDLDKSMLALKSKAVLKLDSKSLLDELV